MDLATARSLLLDLPGVTEAPHMDYGSFRLRKRIITTVPPDGDHLHVFVEDDLARAVSAAHAASCEELWWGKQLLGVRVTLSKADDDVVELLLHQAWRKRASKTMIREFDAGREVAGG